MRNQIKYLQEDIIWHLDLIITVLAFGFNFPGWIIVVCCVMTLIQFGYACVCAYHEKEDK
jgi:hypothetical protein